MCREDPFLEQADRIKAYVKEETGLDSENVPRDVLDSLSERWVCLHAEKYRDCMKKKENG